MRTYITPRVLSTFQVKFWQHFDVCGVEVVPVCQVFMDSHLSFDISIKAPPSSKATSDEQPKAEPKKRLVSCDNFHDEFANYNPGR
jgi:hypothetical protein